MIKKKQQILLTVLWLSHVIYRDINTFILTPANAIYEIITVYEIIIDIIQS